MIDFEKYDKENPQIWTAFKEVTLKAINEKGYKNAGAKQMIEIIRWETSTPNGNDGFKINNNYAPDYARKFMKEFPEHDGFFRTRQMKHSRTTNTKSI